MPDTADEAAQHARWMNEAITLARSGMRIHGGGPFGAVVVCNGELVGRGCNQVTPLLDPTAHAEVVAIRDACHALQRFDLRGCVLYTSCEPCPMCLSAIYWARLDRVYFASTRKDAAGIGFDDDFIYQQIPLDLTARSLPMVQLPIAAAADLFAEWSAKPDKIPY
jgi:tRNA(Arg) A34 adenosine deaminase TadA